MVKVLLFTMDSAPSIAPSRLRQRSSCTFFPSSAPTSYISLQSLRQRRASSIEPSYLSNTFPVKISRKHTLRRRQGKMPFLETHCHPFLFAMMTLSAMAELGLTSFLISAGNENGTWPSPRYHTLLIMFCFNAGWTTLFSTTYMLWYVDGASHFLANVASSVFWLLATSVLWGTAAGIMHNTRTGSDCARVPTISRCRQSLTVEALGWTEFGLCALTMLVTCLWVISSRHRSRIEPDLSQQRLV